MAGWTISVQWLLGATIAGRLVLHVIVTRRRPVAWLWAILLAPLLPLRDTLSLSLWLIGFFGRQVTWAGREFDVAEDGLFRDIVR